MAAIALRSAHRPHIIVEPAINSFAVEDRLSFGDELVVFTGTAAPARYHWRAVAAGRRIVEEQSAAPVSPGGEAMVPHIQANNIEVYYEVQGKGEPLVLIPYLAADQGCYAFQVADYATRFTCYTVDLRGAGLSGKPDGEYSTELFADDVAAFMNAVGLASAHVSGLSLGAATGMWLAAKHPSLVKSLSLHSAWPATDPYLRAVVQGWQTMAKELDSTTDLVIQGIFPWCFTPELYAAKPEYVGSLADFVRSRPMPPVDAFLRQSSAVIAHDASGMLGRIQAPCQITFGERDVVTSTRFAGPLAEQIKDPELVIFEGCAHAPIYEKVAEFNAKTMDFLIRQSQEGR